jgi:hypothetical protein
MFYKWEQRLVDSMDPETQRWFLRLWGAQELKIDAKGRRKIRKPPNPLLVVIEPR